MLEFKSRLFLTTVDDIKFIICPLTLVCSHTSQFIIALCYINHIPKVLELQSSHARGAESLSKNPDFLDVCWIRCLNLGKISSKEHILPLLRSEAKQFFTFFFSLRVYPFHFSLTPHVLWSNRHFKAYTSFITWSQALEVNIWLHVLQVLCSMYCMAGWISNITLKNTFIIQHIWWVMYCIYYNIS